MLPQLRQVTGFRLLSSLLLPVRRLRCFGRATGVDRPVSRANDPEADYLAVVRGINGAVRPVDSQIGIACQATRLPGQTGNLASRSANESGVAGDAREGGFGQLSHCAVGDSGRGPRTSWTELEEIGPYASRTWWGGRGGMDTAATELSS
jgi:hypothetical protein